MQLETYISDLLYRYDCVTVPGFGAFLTNRVSAKIHESTHTFYPPKKVLSFNEQLQSNNGLLANYIAEVEKIPYQVAVEKIAKQVKSIKSYLSEDETITFQNIGDLLLNTEGSIVFNPSYHINYLTDSFGLSHFNSTDITREIHKEIAVAVEEKAPIALTPEKRSNNWLKYAATAVIVLGLGGLTAGKIYNDSVNQHNQIVQQEANDQIENKIQEATFFISNPLPAASLSIEKQTGNYHIVAGAFRVEANSDKKVKQLRDLGYKARKIGMNRYGLYEVVYSSYDNRTEAQNAMYKIRKAHNKEAWLLVKNLNK
ncbi:MAG: HU-CCDC81 and SPOR domain-containing protein [Winogradskyella sp.]|uniref:HU domain-containing protein n=1 Tax=Winogradskyella sp. TaxID=1883156 RepID=UPI0017AEC14F|nr:SPOR domain-containing protein [Winogradskyella sp.]MBT8246041.1 SPOR domain-containing protein [Winogradskyella sp.]NNK22250.1 HU-CCDC81 and SPOR domain-containing protein [Winogradskyella sp.]